MAVTPTHPEHANTRIVRTMLNVSYTVIGIGRAYNAGSTYQWYWRTDFGGYLDKTLQPTGTPNATPTADSVSPNSGTGTAQTFNFVFPDANGYTDLSYTQCCSAPVLPATVATSNTVE